MKRYLILGAVLVCGIFGCKKFLSEVNADPTQFTTASPAAILQGCFKKTTDVLAAENMTAWWDIAHILRDGSRYGVGDNNLWQPLYVNVLEGIRQIQNEYGNDSTFKNQVQIARIWQSYVFYILTVNYGPVAKTQANNLSYNDNIIYDDEDTVYRQILDTLKDAVSKININNTIDKLAYDVIYKGDLNKWIKFGNTLRLEIALNCRRNLGDYADQNIKDVMADEANTLNAESETAKMPYENVTNNQNPYYIKYKFNTFNSPDQIPVMSDFMFLYFRSYKDPRLYAYFDSVPSRDRLQIQDTLSSANDDSLRVVTYPVPYFGRPEQPNLLASWTSLANLTSPLAGANDTSYSRPRGYGYGAQTDPMPANSLFGPATPFIIMSYAQSEFLKAEAAALGLGGSETAQQYYEQGIEANFAYWGLTQQQAIDYINQNGIKWGTQGSGFYNYLGIVKADIPSDNLSKIWVQSWLNFYPDQALESWTLQRRTRVLDLPPLTNPGSGVINTLYQDIPDRSPYPTTMAGLNPAGYADALKKLGIGGSVNDLYPYVPLKFMVPFTVKDWDATVPFYTNAFAQKWYGNTVQDLDAAGVHYTVLATYQP